MDLAAAGELSEMSWIQTAIYLGLSFGAFQFVRNSPRRYRIPWGMVAAALAFLAYNKEGDLHELVWASIRESHQEAIVSWGLEATPWVLRLGSLGLLFSATLVVFAILIRRGMRISRGCLVVLAGFAITAAYAGLRFFAGQKGWLEGSLGNWIEMSASFVMGLGLRIEEVHLRRQGIGVGARTGARLPRRRHKNPEVQRLRHPRFASEGSVPEHALAVKDRTPRRRPNSPARKAPPIDPDVRWI